MADRKHLEQLYRSLADSGKLIEAGWVGARLGCNLIDVPPNQLNDMRVSFFLGAQHLFESMTSMFDPGNDITENDMRRLNLLSAELETFIADFAAKHMPTKGTA